MKKRFVSGIVAVALLGAAGPSAAQDKKTPYWASIASGKAMMRTGPGRNYPGTWLYQRRDLPIRVHKVYENWRLIEDPDGVKGWMLVTLLSDRRTAFVRPGQPRNVHSGPSESAPVRYRLEPGVVGRIDQCGGGWCHIAVGKKDGYIRATDFWGLGAGEVLD